MYIPGKNTAAITRMASSTTSFEMSFIIRLNSIAFRTFFTNPLFNITVFSPKMFLDSDQIAECVTRVVVQTTRFRTNEHSFSNHRSFSLQ